MKFKRLPLAVKGQRRLRKLFRRLHKLCPRLISVFYKFLYAGRISSGKKGVCVIATLSPVPVRWMGKMRSRTFLRPFCLEISRLGYSVRFANSTVEIENFLEHHQGVMLINVFGEDAFSGPLPDLDLIEGRFKVVFNLSRSGKVMADKWETQKLLSEHGVLMPKISDGSGDSFIRARVGTALPTAFIPAAENVVTVDEEKEIANRFVDTVVPYGDEEFYTTVRLLCINEQIVHAYVRARNCREGNPSVHASDTPLDPELIEFLQRTLVVPNWEKFSVIAERIHGALGNGFFAHDVLLERNSGKIFLCETGFKFDDYSYWVHLNAVRNLVKSHAIFFPPEDYARHAAGVFVAKVERCLLYGSTKFAC